MIYIDSFFMQTPLDFFLIGRLVNVGVGWNATTHTED